MKWKLHSATPRPCAILITAKPIASDVSVAEYPFEDWDDLPDDLDESDEAAAARRELETVHALHFPVAFPEVFLRDRPGFDVIVGNPPWQEATIEEDAFWARHSPGLRDLPQRGQEAKKTSLRSTRSDLVDMFEAEKAEMFLVRKALVSGGYPGMGTGDPDLYKAFLLALLASVRGRPWPRGSRLAAQRTGRQKGPRLSDRRCSGNQRVSI